MTPTPNPTPTPKSIHSLLTPSRTTPISKHRLHFTSSKPPNPSHRSEPQTPDHPVEVVSRIRNHPDQKEKLQSGLTISSNHIRVRTEIGYRDFTLDGVSVSEEEEIDDFYKKFIRSRINGVKLGEKCTVMMYGPTGAGKSHTMFGCQKQPGIVYRALKDILGVNEDDESERVGFGSFVQVSVLEIYNEEIYDLLSNTSTGGGFGIGWPKGNASKVRLEVMGKKAKNATFLSGNEAGKISREVAKVEKRRIVKSTHCNERSSRSHCMIILDVPTVGGRLMLVDMAGSENIEQAGQAGFEAKMQTAKINQGNIALKRVVESIANGDSHVPFRDSKLTMLLQDSFEDDKSKILMILCCSPDPREIHKTISTLEYGAKAKCIVRGGHTPNKDKINTEDGSSAVILGSRIAAMDQFIAKLQMESRRREKERNEAHKELTKKEEEVAVLRAKLEVMEKKRPIESEEEINMKIKEREQILKAELENKLQECQKMADDFVETERRIMEEKILQQQQELHMLSQRLVELEAELRRTKGSTVDEKLQGKEESGLAKRMMELYGDQGMEKSMDLVKSMDLDMGDRHPVVVHVVKELDKGASQPKTCRDFSGEKPSDWSSVHVEEDNTCIAPKFPEKVYLSTVYEDEEEQDKENTEDEEVEKEVVEESTVHTTLMIEDTYSEIQNSKPYTELPEKDEYFSLKRFVENDAALELSNKRESTNDPESARKTRIQNIFLLCGNHRELAHQVGIPTRNKISTETADVHSSPLVVAHNEDYKENNRPDEGSDDGMIEVYVKWEATKECPGKFITKLKVKKDTTLADLRKLIEIDLGDNSSKQGFNFLLLGDPSGAPVGKEKESSVEACKLPICNNQPNIRFACLRAMKEPNREVISVVPFSSLENKLLSKSPPTSGYSPKVGNNGFNSSSPLLSSMFIERNF